MRDFYKETKEKYNEWYANNVLKLEAQEFHLLPQTLWNNPEHDFERGVNLLAFVPTDVSENIDRLILTKLISILDNSAYIIPHIERHITVFDMLPHNCGLKESELQEEAQRYVPIIHDAIYAHNNPIPIVIDGIFASPDGITLQGFPKDNTLYELRRTIREQLIKAGLRNEEHKKYTAETAHIALAKFYKPVEGKELVRLVNRLRSCYITEFHIQEMVLTISSRYDKAKTLKKVYQYSLK